MSAPTLREALIEIRGRLNCHPAYADLTEADEERVGGDTAEFSYLVRVADEALAQPDDVPEGCTPADAMVLREANHALAVELDAARAARAQQGEPVAWLNPRGGVLQRLDTGLERATYTIPLYAAPQPAALAQHGDPSAWMHADGRVVTEATMSTARRDGGAMLSSLAGYTIPLYAGPQPAPVAQPLTKYPDAALAWDEGYRAGINDERTSEANIGIAGFGAKVQPARNNPYRVSNKIGGPL